jgi:phosphate transport system substrate-binding protein
MPPSARRIRRARPYGILAALVLAGVAVAFYDAIRPHLSTSAAAARVTPSSLPAVDLGQVQTTFRASGATFPHPLYAQLFAEYNRLRPGVKIEYAAIGSGAGIAQFASGQTDFGATDAPMTDDQMRAARGGEVLHVPLTLGAVVPVYRLPGLATDRPLVFSGPVLADVFRGTITRWDDPALAALNPGVPLPAAPITVVHRADGSGTTYVFADYLAKVSPDFAAAAGPAATTVDWPAPRKAAAHGNDGVLAAVAKTPGALGYVELTHAMRTGAAFGSVVNAAGRPVQATLASVSAAAAAAAPTRPEDLRASITNAPGDDAYPIAAFSYLLIYRDQPDRTKAHALADFLTWAVTDGQKLAPTLHYAPLPSDVTALTQGIIQHLRVNGRHFASAE